MPERIQMSRQRPWRADNPDAVIVARPSKWGNPWKVGERSAYWMGPGLDSPSRPRPVPLMDASEVTGIFANALRTGYGNLPFDVEQVRTELAGKDLACWCPLDQPCHADVLLEIANGDS